jgi:hypothetical protein
MYSPKGVQFEEHIAGMPIHKQKYALKNRRFSDIIRSRYQRHRTKGVKGEFLETAEIVKS